MNGGFSVGQKCLPADVYRLEGAHALKFRKSSDIRNGRTSSLRFPMPLRAETELAQRVDGKETIDQRTQAQAEDLLNQISAISESQLPQENQNEATIDLTEDRVPSGQSQLNGHHGANLEAPGGRGKAGNQDKRRSKNRSGNAESNKRTGLIEDFPYQVGDFVLGQVVWEDPKVGWRVKLVAHPDIVGLMPPMYKPYTLKDSLEDFFLPAGAKGIVRMFQIERVSNQMYYNGKGPVMSARGWDFNVIWRRAEQVRQIHTEKTDTLAVKFRSVNNSGLLGVWDGIPLFVPWKFACQYDKHLSDKNKQESVRKRLEAPKCHVRIVDVNPVKNRFVGNLVEADQIRALEGAQIGDLMEGEVQAIQPYGVFVRMGENGAIKGLLHIRNVSQARTDDLANYFKVGETIKAFLFDVDEKNQVEFSTMELETYPGEVLEDPETVWKTAETRGSFWDLHDSVRGQKAESQGEYREYREQSQRARPQSGQALDWD